MALFDLNQTDGPHLPTMAEIREPLRDRMEELFRAQWGDPLHAGGREWRPRDDDARSMVMRGPKRGAWTDHKAGLGGGPLEFYAVHCLGWDAFPHDRDGQRVLREEVARFLGIDVSTQISVAELERRRAERAKADALRVAEAVEHDREEQAQRAALVAAVQPPRNPQERSQMAHPQNEPQISPEELLRERGQIAQRSYDLARKASQQARVRWARIGELAVEVHDAHPTAPGLVDAWRNAFLASQVSAPDLADAIWLHESNLAASTVPWIISHPTAIRSAWTSFATDAAVQFVASGSADIGALAKQIGMDEVEAHQLVGQAVLVTAIGHIDHGDAGAARGILAALIAQSQAENGPSSGHLGGRPGDGGALRRSMPATAASGAHRAPLRPSTNSTTHSDQGGSQKADTPAIDHTGQIFPSALAMCSHWGVPVWSLGPSLKDGLTLEQFLTMPRRPSSDDEIDEYTPD